MNCFFISKLRNGLKKFFSPLVRRAREFIFEDVPHVVSNFDSHDGELSTCAIAFFLLISFIPASLVIISILSFFYGSGDIAEMYLNQIKTQLPSINLDELITIIDRIIYKKRFLAFIWVPFLFWWGSLVFDIIERALEKAFRIEESRKYWKAKIRHFLIILGFGLFILLLTFFSNFLVILKNSSVVHYLHLRMDSIDLVHDILLGLSSVPLLFSSGAMLVLNSLFVFGIYRFVPPKKMDNGSLFKGALFSSLSYEIVKMVFSYYITEINDYTSIFGSLSSVVILMIWIWYTCFLFVIGAELAWVFYERKERSQEFDFDSDSDAQIGA